jgi:hypothetical protein
MREPIGMDGNKQRLCEVMIMGNRLERFFFRRSIAIAAVLLPLGAGTGCSSQLPCLQYQPQMVTRTVQMRGFGSVQVREQAMVCTARAQAADDIFGF